MYWNILTMQGPINVKSPNNTSKWQMGLNSAFKGLSCWSYKGNALCLLRRRNCIVKYGLDQI
jgi:hypothetical protein